MDWERATIIISALFGGGGIVALLKARSDVRNANKTTDIQALEATIKTIQESNKELQDRYQEVITENEGRCQKLAERLSYLEGEYSNHLKRITELEIDLRKANDKITVLEEELCKRNEQIVRLEQENIILRKQNNKLGLML